MRPDSHSVRRDDRAPPRVARAGVAPVARMTDLELGARRTLIRVDLNVPLDDGAVSSDRRIRAALPTIRRACVARARVILLSHLGRPAEGRFDERYSLKPVARRLSELLGREVRVERDWLGGVEVGEGEVVLCENVRFERGESSNDEPLSRRMAALCEVFVMDAFGAAHRAHASTHGVARFAPVACAGPLLSAEIEALSAALDNPPRPLVAIVGGAKVSTKLAVLDNLCGIVDRLIVGGGIANTFIACAGHDVGKSLYEPAFLDEARRLMARMRARGGTTPIPVDVVCAKRCAADAEAAVKPVEEVAVDDVILDLGPRSAARLRGILEEAGAVVWNGPLGVFEFDQFGEGTRVLCEAIAAGDAFSVAGGGDTVAAAEKYGIVERISCVSTGGGAFLEFIEGRKLPAVEILKQRARGDSTTT